MFTLKVEEFDSGRDDLYLDVKGEKHELFIYEDSVEPQASRSLSLEARLPPQEARVL